MFYIFLRTKLALHRPLCARFFLLFTKSYLMGIRLPLLKRSVLYFYELLMSRLRRLQRHNCPHLKGLTYDLKIYVDNAVVEVRTTKTTIVDSEVQRKKSLSLKSVWLFPFYLHSTSLFTLFSKRSLWCLHFDIAPFEKIIEPQGGTYSRA